MLAPYPLNSSAFGNGPVYNAREELENVDLLLRFGLTSTLIRDDNRTFSKPEKFENAGFSFSSGRKTFRKRLFLFPRPSFPYKQIQNDR